MVSKIKESEVQKLILDYLRLKGCLVFKVNNGGVYIRSRDCYMKSPMKGISDIVGLTKKGQFLAIEVKKRGKTPCKDGKPSSEQLEFLAQVKQRKGIGILAYSLDDVIEII
jgi:Holliday junction resolvase